MNGTTIKEKVILIEQKVKMIEKLVYGLGVIMLAHLGITVI